MATEIFFYPDLTNVNDLMEETVFDYNYHCSKAFHLQSWLEFNNELENTCFYLFIFIFTFCVFCPFMGEGCALHLPNT